MTLRLVVQGVPIPKKRPRFSRRGSKVVTFDEQSNEKRHIKCLLMKEMADNRVLKRIESNISVQMTFHTPIPKTWSQKRSKLVLGKPDGTRPDLDNYIKMYADVMNQLIYHDDNQITQLWSEKVYSDKPRVEIFITEIKDGDMINEHATTVKGEITLEDLNYMVRKANRLGLKNREMIRVFMVEDDEGKHYYFEVEGMKDATRK